MLLIFFKICRTYEHSKIRWSLVSIPPHLEQFSLELTLPRSDECKDSPDGMNSSDDFKMENSDDESDLELLLSDIELWRWSLLE